MQIFTGLTYVLKRDLPLLSLVLVRERFGWTQTKPLRLLKPTPETPSESWSRTVPLSRRLLPFTLDPELENMLYLRETVVTLVTVRERVLRKLVFHPKSSGSEDYVS